jgi:hypothetical protein
LGTFIVELIEELFCFRAAADLEILKYYLESLIVPKFSLYSFLSRQFAIFSVEISAPRPPPMVIDWFESSPG